MSDFNWCHGPKCHKHHTLDRVRGVKGSKVLRTRKVQINNWNKDSFYSKFCSNGCYNDFANKYVNEITAIAPRPDALETPIHNPEKKTITTEYGYSYSNTEIKVDETRQIDQDNPITERYNMNKKIKAEYLPGGAKRQELLDQVPEYLKTPGLQSHKHMFCVDVLKLTETEYLEALNKATNGGVVEAVWN